jgi:elongation factor Ts
MMECKKALAETSGDMEKALLWLRERGLSRAAKKADRVAAEGVVEFFITEDANAGALIEFNCETDFAAKNEAFRAMAKELAILAVKTASDSVETLGAAKLPNGTAAKDAVANLIATVGENMTLRRVKYVRAQNGTVAGYNHMGGRIGTLVVIEGAQGPKALEAGKDIAMHVAAASPRYLKSSEVNTAELAQERELAKKKLEEQGKPAAMIEKIVEGQMSKFYKEVCLLEQAFVKDPNLSITQVLKEKVGGTATLTQFVRFQLGEGIEKKQENFAEEVAAAARQ